MKENLGHAAAVQSDKPESVNQFCDWAGELIAAFMSAAITRQHDDAKCAVQARACARIIYDTLHVVDVSGESERLASTLVDHLDEIPGGVPESIANRIRLDAKNYNGPLKADR